MKFSLHKYPQQIIIKAYPEYQAETWGYRSESPFPKIYLRDHVELIFKPKFSMDFHRMHPDQIALLCFLSFYPFLKKNITFPLPVSTTFAQAIEAFPYFVVKSNKYQNQGQPYKVNNQLKNMAHLQGGKTMVLAYGGGLDSSATLTMFPELLPIHESRLGFPDRTENFMQQIDNHLSGTSYVIHSNNKDLTTEPGWTGWISCISTSILLVQELNIGVIMLGSSMGSSYLTNGQEYHPVHLNPLNHWYQLLEKCGIQVCSPIAGLSEFALGNLLHQQKSDWLHPHSGIIYCIKGNDGGNCHKCFKCFRRDILIAYITNNLDYIKKWYSSEKWLASDPLIGGPSFHYSLINLESEFKKNPTLHWILPCIKRIKQQESTKNIEKWIAYHYIKSSIMLPGKYRSWIVRRIRSFIPDLPKNHEKYLESWNIS